MNAILLFYDCRLSDGDTVTHLVKLSLPVWFLGGLSKPPYSITHDNLRLAIWDTSF